jgi:hypothetical protein
MASIHQLIVNLEERQGSGGQPGGHPARRESSAKTIQRSIDVPKEVLKFAPKRMRVCDSAEDRVRLLEDEIDHWRNRAGRAEARLQFIEERIQRMAAPYVRQAPQK